MSYIIMGAIIGAIVGVVYVIAKKDSKERDEMVAKLTEAEKEEHDVKVGDFVKMYFAPEKTVGSVKIVF